MDRIAPPWNATRRYVALVLLAFFFGVNVYRAWTQSITADEAFTYNHYAGGDEPLDAYHANNHILHTELVRLSTSLLGVTEFTVRLPSLLGGLLYLIAVFRLSRYVFGESWLFLLSVASMSLNPYVLDFLSSARGYGMGLAFTLWAVYELVRYLREEHDPAAFAADKRRLHRAALAMALAVAANLTFAFPNAALAAVFGLILVADSGRGAAWRQVSGALRHFTAPGLLVAAAFLAWPLRFARREDFYAGSDALNLMLNSLISSSFVHSSTAIWPALRARLWGSAFRIVPALFLLTGVLLLKIACDWIRWREFRRLKAIDQFTFVAGGSLLASLGLLVATHHALGVKYPAGRTGIFWIPLFTLACLGVIGTLRSRLAPFLLAGAPCALFLVLCTVQYALQFETRYYAEWLYDANTKRIAEVIRARHAAHPKEKVRLGVSWLFEPSLNFYRQAWRLSWMQRLHRGGPLGDYDYYVLSGDDAALVDKLRLTPVYKDGLSGAVVAAPLEPAEPAKAPR